MFNSLFKSDIFGEKRFAEIHEGSLKILSGTGMKFLSDEILESLEKNGCTIDHGKKVARFPGRLVEEKLAHQKGLIANGKKQVILNGGVSSRCEDKISCKFGSGAFYIFDWENQKKVRAGERHVAESIRFGHALDEVGVIGVPIFADTYEGEVIDPNVMPLVKALIVSLNTSKVGNNEVNTTKQLKYLMEMGTVIRGSKEEYLKDPCFITAKHTVSPLQLDRDACDVLIALAKNGLPSNMIPMPIIGTSVPATLSGAMMVANAEMLATMTAVKTIVDDAIVLGGVMPATTDMKTGFIDYDTPDAIKMDLAMTMMYEDFYGFDFGFGNYCSDAKFLGPEIIQQRTLQLMGTVFMKRLNPPIALYDKGMVYSPELAIIEIEILRYLISIFTDSSKDSLEEILEAVNSAGPGGSFLGESHTMKNFKKIFKSEILGEIVDSVNNTKLKGSFGLANEKYRALQKNSTPFALPAEKERELKNILRIAKKDILGA